MAERHEMTCETNDARGALFVCPQCGRRVVLSHVAGEGYTIIDEGDFYALHHGSTMSGVSLAAGVSQPGPAAE